MIWLSKDDIIFLHDELVRNYGGSLGIRDEGMLESALATPMQTFDNVDLYPSPLQKAARLGYGLTCNHPFIDGNKRIGAHAMVIVLKLNGYKLKAENKELSDVILGIAAGNLGYSDLENWIIEHITDKSA